jgi:hypothetical protein
MYILKNKANSKYVMELKLLSAFDYIERYPTYELYESEEIEERMLLLSYPIANLYVKVLKKEYGIEAEVVELKCKYYE